MKETKSLAATLRDYGLSDWYPLHMPGHKRRLGGMPDPFQMDITEICGFDNLHHAQGLLRDAQQRAAQLYGARESFFLVGGSSAGILSAVTACARDSAIVARNCHRSVYHAAGITGLKLSYVVPEEIWPEINGRIPPAGVEEALRRAPEAEAVVITSPTYDGVVSDVASIAAIVHAAGKILIVDEAHGAHFGFHRAFPDSAVHQGADVVIQSLHKTLPSLTQTALLHVCTDRPDIRKIRRMLCAYQTSSPSYVLLASMDSCIRRMQAEGEALLEALRARLEDFYREAGKLKNLALLRTDDPSRILIGSGQSGLSGPEICAILRQRFHLEPEMCMPSHVLCLMSVGDTQEGFDRLKEALREIDAQCPGAGAALSSRAEAALPSEAEAASISGAGAVSFSDPAAGRRKTPVLGKICMTIREAWNSPAQEIPLSESEGFISGDFVYLYPPGIPLLVPGERILRETLSRLEDYRRMGFELQGPADFGERIQVISQMMGQFKASF